MLFDLHGINVLRHHGSDRIFDKHQLEDSDSSLVTCVRTDRAAAPPVERYRTVLNFQARFGQFLSGRCVGFAAIEAKNTDQTLSQYAHEGGADQKGFHAHVNQSGDRACGVVRMKRGKNEVTR